MMLLVDNAEAKKLIESIPYRTCVDASAKNWIVSDQGRVRARSVLWLFCWGKTGRRSKEAARAARAVFDRMFEIKFAHFDALVDHQYDCDNRYSDFDLEAELTRLLHPTPRS